MSGYLHRLAHAVSHPRETVHPRTGSLFAPYRSAPDSRSELFGQAEAVTTHPERAESSTTGEHAGIERRTARSDYLQPPLRPRTANEPPRVFESPAGNEARHDTLEHALQAPRRFVDSQAQRAVPDSRSDAGVQTYEPLIQPRRSAANSTSPETPKVSTEANSMRKARVNLPAEGRPTRAIREPDEIQIHIGRIEVTAVQPPASRAPRVPDKAISLDAYLERLNGRAR